MNPSTLLNKGLKHVIRHGWTKDAIAAGAVEMGLPPVVHGIIPNASGKLVSYHQQLANEEMKKELAQYLKESPSPKTPEEIAEFAIWTRLNKTIPVYSNWAQALAIGLKPENASNTAQLLGDMADTIISNFGKQQSQFEWYSSRAAFSAAYCACELHMLSDYSEGYGETKNFFKKSHC